MKYMICLGIESTSHTFSASLVIDSGKILSNEKSTLVTKRGEGFVPKEMADHHMKNAARIIKKCLKNYKLKDVDLISFSQGMGIPNSLKVGATVARYLALKYKKPLIGVNHAIGHIEIGKLTTKAKDPVIVYLSGGNTQIIAFTEGRYRIFGETEDIAVGNVLDTLARELKLPSPGGQRIEQLAKKGKYIDLPYVVKGMDLSFTGILTDAIKKIKNVGKEDICFSIQETCFSMLTEVTERALAHTDKKEVLLVGGVAVNKRLQEMLNIMCKERGAKLFVVPKEYSSDQAAMIAWTGILAHKSGQKTKDSRIKSKWRVEEVEISWV